MISDGLSIYKISNLIRFVNQNLNNAWCRVSAVFLITNSGFHTFWSIRPPAFVIMIVNFSLQLKPNHGTRRNSLFPCA